MARIITTSFEPPENHRRIARCEGIPSIVNALAVFRMASQALDAAWREVVDQRGPQRLAYDNSHEGGIKSPNFGPARHRNIMLFLDANMHHLPHFPFASASARVYSLAISTVVSSAWRWQVLSYSSNCLHSLPSSCRVYISGFAVTLQNFLRSRCLHVKEAMPHWRVTWDALAIPCTCDWHDAKLATALMFLPPQDIEISFRHEDVSSVIDVRACTCEYIPSSLFSIMKIAKSSDPQGPTLPLCTEKPKKKRQQQQNKKKPCECASDEQVERQQRLKSM